MDIILCSIILIIGGVFFLCVGFFADLPESAKNVVLLFATVCIFAGMIAFIFGIIMKALEPLAML